MRNLKITLEYDGTRYAGWQVQNNSPSRKPTLQETVEKALFAVTAERPKLTAASRTDAGVHALAQVANFSLDSRLSVSRLRSALNALLPDDVSVVEVAEVGEGFHSRYGAKAKHYRYAILNREVRPARERHLAYFFPHPLDVALMQREAGALVGTHDFRAFQASGGKEKATVKTLTRVSVKKAKDSVLIDVIGSGFLYHMVRVIAGTLLDIGRGRLPAGSMRAILASGDRRKAGPTAPAQGLTLVRVWYK